MKCVSELTPRCIAAVEQTMRWDTLMLKKTNSARSLKLVYRSTRVAHNCMVVEPIG